MDARPLLASIFDAFGVPGVVKVDAEDTVATTVVWVPSTTEDWPGGREMNRREEREVLAVSRVEVPEIPKGTRITAPRRLDGAIRVFRVDGFDRVEADLWRLIVLDVTDQS